MASHQDNEWEFKGQIYQVKPGQFVTSLESLQEKCAKDVSIQNIRTCLLKLEKHRFLTNESTNKNRLITVVKWDFYQHPSENQQANQQSSNKQLTTINNDKNEKNKTNRRFTPPTLDEVKSYFKEKGTWIDPELFHAHYEASGWKRNGNVQIKNWKSCLVTWENRNPRGGYPKGPKQEVARQNLADDYSIEYAPWGE
jgi:DNA replication protein DnaD